MRAQLAMEQTLAQEQLGHASVIRVAYDELGEDLLGTENLAGLLGGDAKFQQGGALHIAISIGL